ncbi:MAG TPA: cytochrome c [Rhizomicrobium sp.]|nr:cytochrome c [Rhizomicrobium sp.]
MRFAGLLLAISCFAAPAFFWTAPAWAESGETMFNEYCVGCHQVGGTGVPGEYPRLAGRVNKIAADSRGRVFLAQLVLTGMSGTIIVDGRKILGIMPAFDNLKDAELAAILNYVVGLESHKGPAFTAQALTQARIGAKVTPEEMARTRNNLAGVHLIP